MVTIKKTGWRTFILNSPIMIADYSWKIFGMCEIQEATISGQETVLKAKVLTLFSEEESLMVSRLIQDAEKVKTAR